jgi:hypothetical protein
VSGSHLPSLHTLVLACLRGIFRSSAQPSTYIATNSALIDAPPESQTHISEHFHSTCLVSLIAGSTHSLQLDRSTLKTTRPVKSLVMAPPKLKASVVVLTDFDLVEDIMLRLPLREVLLIKRVNKAWKGIHDESVRVQKALFLTPATEHKIYYPDCSKPTWYLSPTRDELIQAGLVSEPVTNEGDGDVTPTNSPKQRNTHLQIDQVKSVTHLEKFNQVDSAEHGVVNNGKFKNNFSFITAGEHNTEDGETCGKAGGHAANGKSKETTYGNQTTCGNQTTYGSQATYGNQGPKMQNTCKALVKFNAGKFNSAETTNNVGYDNGINIFGRKASGQADIAFMYRAAQYAASNNLPKILAKPDGKMLVSRVTSPFINPFCEIFIERFYRGIRGGFYTADFIPGGTAASGNSPLHVLPQIRLPDGTTEGRSRCTRAVQRYDASWRKMNLFSEITSSIEVECFDFDSFEVFLDHGMTAGYIMEVLGQHWSITCPDCCILDFWFREFIDDVCHIDNSHWNRGKHGVKKLGLNHTGWEILAMLGAGRLETTDFKDRIRPF